MTSTPSWRHTVRQLLGQFPARPPLALEGGESDATEHYTRTPISYAVEAGERVSAWLLLPHGPPLAGGWPALLAVHQHAGAYELGKSEPAGLSVDPMYHYGHDLCAHGYAVLCPRSHRSHTSPAFRRIPPSLSTAHTAEWRARRGCMAHQMTRLSS